MKKVTFSQEQIGDTIKIQGKLHVMYGKDTVTRMNEDEEVTEYIAYVDPAISDNAEYIASRIAKLENELITAKAQSYLDSTDWIVVKINEAQVLGQDIQPMLDKYATELTKREECRGLL